MRPRPYILGTKIDVAALLAEERAYYESKAAEMPVAKPATPPPLPASANPVSEPATFDGTPHTDWCTTYNVATDPERCARCDACRNRPAEAWPELRNDVAALNLKRAEFITALRREGAANPTFSCPVRRTFGETVEKICCGGKKKRVEAFRCWHGLSEDASPDSAPLIHMGRCVGCTKVRRLPCGVGG